MTLPPENQREALARAAAETFNRWTVSELAQGKKPSESEIEQAWNEANMNRREEDRGDWEERPEYMDRERFPSVDVHEHCDDHPCRECTIKSDLDAYDRAEEGQ